MLKIPGWARLWLADAFACQAGPMRQPEPIVVWR